MPNIRLEFSIPEDPNRNKATVIIEGSDESGVAKSAIQIINHFTGGDCDAV